MDIFSFFTLFGGLAMFIFGMTTMSQNLEKVAGGKMETILNQMTANRFSGLALGAVITIAIQSSSAVTVMLVGLVNSGILDLSNTVGVIMGSNIGTTVTAWIMSLIGVDSSNFFIRLLKPESFSPILAFIGILMIMVSKKERRRDIGTIFVGFAILMYGMTLMSSSVSPLAESKKFMSLLTAFNNPLLGILTGTVVTAVIQSSAASIGMLQALSMTGGITWNMAMPIVMGQNIGTCATAIISSIGVSKNAKRVSVIHIAFNLIGTALFMIVYLIVVNTVDFAFLDEAIDPVGIALFHSVFNIVTTAVLLPFTNWLVRIAKRVIRTDNDNEKPFLDERLLKTPSVAAAESANRAREMAVLSREAAYESIAVVYDWDEKRAQDVLAKEQSLDGYADHIATFLMHLSGTDLTEQESRQVSMILHTIDDFERISDHALNIVQTARELHDRGSAFSEESMNELHVLGAAVEEILHIAYDSYLHSDTERAKEVEPLEEVIDRLTERIRVHHIDRLRVGTCTVENGFTLNDYLTDLERISDHCSNIAVAVIEVRNNSFDTHEYIDENLDMSNAEFRKKYQEYKAKYRLPHRHHPADDRRGGAAASAAASSEGGAASDAGARESAEADGSAPGPAASGGAAGALKTD